MAMFIPNRKESPAWDSTVLDLYVLYAPDPVSIIVNTLPGESYTKLLIPNGAKLTPSKD